MSWVYAAKRWHPHVKTNMLGRRWNGKLLSFGKALYLCVMSLDTPAWTGTHTFVVSVFLLHIPFATFIYKSLLMVSDRQ